MQESAESTNALVLSSIMFVAGVGIPIMAALNGGLGVRLVNPNFAVLLLFLVVLAVTGIIVGPGSEQQTELDSIEDRYRSALKCFSRNCSCTEMNGFAAPG